MRQKAISVMLSPCRRGGRAMKRFHLFLSLFLMAILVSGVRAQDGMAPGIGLKTLRKGVPPPWVKPGLVLYYRGEGGSRTGGTGSYLVMEIAYLVWEVEGNRILGVEVQASQMGVKFIPKLLGRGGDGLFWIDPQRASALLSPQALEEARRQGIALSGGPGMIVVDYAPQGRGVSRVAVRYDVQTGLVLSREECSWSEGRDARGATCTKTSYVSRGQLRLPRLRDLPPAAAMRASYHLQMVEQYTGMAVPAGGIQVEPVGRDGKLTRYRLITLDPNTGMPLPPQEVWGIPAMGPHYRHPELLRGSSIVLPDIGIEWTGGQTILWNGVPWETDEVDPQNGLILSFQARTYGGTITGILGE